MRLVDLAPARAATRRLPTDEPKRPVGTHQAAHRRQATRGNSSTQTASRCVGSGRAGSRPHTRRARPIGRRANDERAAQHRVAVAAAAAAVVRRASGTHMHSVSQQRASAIACATCSRHVVSLTSDQRVGGASQRTRALGLSAEIGSARVAGAWWARVSAAEHDRRRRGASRRNKAVQVGVLVRC